MATLLYRLGRFAFRKAWLVIGIWVAVLAAALGSGLALGGTMQESYTIPGTQSQAAIDHLEAVFPQAAGASAQVVVEAPNGEHIDDPANKDAVEAMSSDLEKIDGVASVLSPFNEYADAAVSKDDTMGIITVQFAEQSYDITEKTLDDVTATADAARDAGLTVAFGGQVFQDTSFGLSVTEVIGVIFAGLVLFITFGSLLTAGMPLLVALLGVGVTMGGVLAVASFTTVSSASPMLAIMLGLAVGIDYSLFILSRHRTQLAHDISPEESAATAVATAGSAVVFAGVTVIIAILGLLVVGIPFLSIMGLAAAVAVLLAMSAAVTLLPALLGLAGARLIPKQGSRAWKRAHAHKGDKPTFGGRWVNIVLKAPIAWVVGVVVVLGALAIPAASLDLNLPTGASDPEGSTSREAYGMLERGFGAGANGPLVVTVDITQTTDVLEDLDTVRDRIAQLDDVASVSAGIPNPTLDTAIIRVTPESAPDSPETKDLVHALRDLGPDIESDLGTPIAVTGATAVAVDISNRLTDALIPFGLVVVGLSIILLMMVFRSVFVPIKAAVGFLLSVGASFGVVVAVFQWGWFADVLGVTPGPILSFLPIIMMALLFGLAMDYEVFLVSGVREHFVHSGDAKEAIRVGSAGAMRVVTAAALIMFFVFAAFVPEGSGVIKGIALGLAVGIAFDAFLVRMTLGPALLALLGRAAWWLPRWLQKALPNVDVEGEGLRKHLVDATWAASQRAAITAEGVRFNGMGASSDVIDVTVPDGGVLVVTGDDTARTLVTWGLAARVDLSEGRLQIAGAPVPSERGRVLRRVALSSLQGQGERTIGDVIAERLEFTAPWWRLRVSQRAVRAWSDRIAEALAEAGLERAAVSVGTPVSSLSRPGRGVVALAAALAERPRIACVDVDGLDRTEVDALLTAANSLAPASTTLVISGLHGPTSDHRPGLRPVVTLAATTATDVASRKDVLA